MARAVVHIGTHKTGTTSLQNWAEKNRNALQASTGLRYYSGIFATTHAEFTLLCMRADRNTQTRARRHDWMLPSYERQVRDHIEEQLAGDDDIFISDEALSYLRHADEVDRLRALLAPRDVEFYVVLRDRQDFLRSYRRQIEAAGFPPSPYPESFAYVAEDTWLIDYESLLETFSHPPVVAYEEAMAQHETIIPALMGQITESTDLPAWQGYRDNVSSERNRPRGRIRRQVRRVLEGAARRL